MNEYESIENELCWLFKAGLAMEVNEDSKMLRSVIQEALAKTLKLLV